MVVRAGAARAQRDEAAPPWNQIQGWVMGKRWQGILDALVRANGRAGFDGPTVHYVRLRLEHCERWTAFDLEVQLPHQLSGHVMILIVAIFQMDMIGLNHVWRFWWLQHFFSALFHFLNNLSILLAACQPLMSVGRETSINCSNSTSSTSLKEIFKWKK